MLRMLKRLPPAKTALAIFFLLVQTGCALYLPYLTAGIVDNGIMAGDVSYIWQQGGVMMIFALLSLGGALLNMYIAGKISFGVGEGLRDDIFTKALGFSKTEYDRFGTSGFITRNTNDVTQVQTVVEMSLKFLILSPLYLIGGIYLTWTLSPTLAIPFLVVIPGMAVAALVIYRFATPLYSKMQTLLDRLNLATLAIVWVGGGAAAAGGMEVGAIMAAVSYSVQILMGFALLTNVILSLPRGQVSAKRINEVLDTEPAIQDAPLPAVPNEISLTFEGVSFRYEGAARKALDDVSFTAQQGQTLAIVGGTGDGKTSLLSLIPRLYDVESGSVRLSGVDVREMGQAPLRAHVSYAPQKSSLLAGTIRSNLLLARPGAGDEEMWAALEDACATEFVSALPGGLDSPVEKGGVNFSGGQRQRLCIARAILKEADVYLFDDSFSALDFKTDAAVRAALRRRLAGKITVIVAQRIGTIAGADVIAVLEKGRLAGLGSHRELLASSPVYREIAESQSYQEVAA